MALAAAAYPSPEYNNGGMDVVEWDPTPADPTSHHSSLSIMTTLHSPFEPPRRADTPCPAALLQQKAMCTTVSLGGQHHRRGGSGGSTSSGSGSGAAFVLLPDGGFANRRFIELGAGTTVVGGLRLSRGGSNVNLSGFS